MQVPSEEQGGGAGRSGPGPLAAIEACVDSGCEVAGANEAAARPAMATSRANMRIAEFIFGNLIDSFWKESFSF
jgi:hypothetical protein